MVVEGLFVYRRLSGSCGCVFSHPVGIMVGRSICGVWTSVSCATYS